MKTIINTLIAAATIAVLFIGFNILSYTPWSKVLNPFTAFQANVVQVPVYVRSTPPIQGNAGVTQSSSGSRVNCIARENGQIVHNFMALPNVAQKIPQSLAECQQMLRNAGFDPLTGARI